MATLTIRDVPEDAHDALVSRATAAGLSLEAYLREHLVELTRGADPSPVAQLRAFAERLAPLDRETLLDDVAADRR